MTLILKPLLVFVNPIQGTSTEHAFNRRVLSAANRDFYLKIWDRAHSSLTSAPAKYKSDLNQRMKRVIQ